LVCVESQEGVGSDFDGDGDVEEVHPADGNREPVLCAEFACGADGVPPVKFGVRPVAGADFLFDEADLIAGVTRIDVACPLRLPKNIEDLDALSRRPDDPTRKSGKRSNARTAASWLASSVIMQAIHHEVSA
jgi:hypothetical protein